MIYEKREKDKYTMVDSKTIENYYEHHKQDNKLKGIDDIPKQKCFDFLRKGFENNPWKNIKYFADFHSDSVYTVDGFYYDYLYNGYVIMMKYHNENNDYFYKPVFNISAFGNEEVLDVLKLNEMKMLTSNCT